MPETVDVNIAEATAAESGKANKGLHQLALLFY